VPAGLCSSTQSASGHKGRGVTGGSAPPAAAVGAQPRPPPARRPSPRPRGPRALPLPSPRARVPDRRAYRLLRVDVDLEGLLLEGLQGDLHGAAATPLPGLRRVLAAGRGLWPGGPGVARVGCSRSREEDGGGGGLSHSPCGASPPAHDPGRAAVSAAFPESSGHGASSRAGR
jgi:hypothetical protein